ncbi:hypothetical protein TrVE_jg4921 [Triparma verrucosa]|uniref:Protein kish n=1 Tax=Triparma verrucosa TaxID=1606542 RepID=A0A9W7BPN5_9STRA|nr:hypothetical protein TrVE_jg4921 [Triparma verrucosa]
MSAIFSFSSLLTVLLLLICTSTYLRAIRPTIFDSSLVANNIPGGRPKRTGVMGFCWKLSRIGERLSPWVSGACVIMAIHILFLQ